MSLIINVYAALRVDCVLVVVDYYATTTGAGAAAAPANDSMQSSGCFFSSRLILPNDIIFMRSNWCALSGLKASFSPNPNKYKGKRTQTVQSTDQPEWH